MLRSALILVVIQILVAPAAAQRRFVVADRTNDALYVLHDADANGIIDEPGEVSLFFNAANAAGTLGPMNPTCLAISPAGVVLFGDQVNRNIYVLHDRNNDGDAQDAGESVVAADAGNASAVSFAFPTGAAFDAAGAMYIVNAGNAFGNDGVYALSDGNNDGDSQDTGEVAVFVGAPVFGPGNGAYSPQELYFDAAGRGWLHNSSTALHGIYRLDDLDNDGNADEAGEFTVFFDASNASGVGATAGFAVDPDAVRPGAMYRQQTAAGSDDQFLRLRDLNADGDAQDAGEAVLVYSTAEGGFTSIDLVSLRDGSVLISENSGKRVIRLRDIDSDDLFTTAGERTNFFSNSSLVLGDLRQIAVFPVRVPADMNCDGAVDFFDIDGFLLALFDAAGYAAANPDCNRYNADVNIDFAVDFFDIDAFLDVLFP